jgi:hypothetical protein
MGLQQRLQSMKAAARGKMSPETLAIMTRALEQLEASQSLQQALGVGERAPDFTLQDSAGISYSSRQLREQGPLVVNFYRGSW